MIPLPSARQSKPYWRWMLMSLSLVGFLLSAYLGWHHLTGRSVIGCGGGSPCDQVLGGQWSVVAGVIPVSGLAAGTYLSLFVASLFIGAKTGAADRQLAWSAMLVLAGAILGSALWFTYIQEWVVGALCLYCIATHITGLFFTILVFWQAPRQRRDSLPLIRLPLIRPRQAIAFAVVGLSLAAILAVGQTVFKPRAVYRSGPSQSSLLAIDPHRSPMIGSPDAPYVVTLLFDYECPQCQRLHLMLDEAVSRYHGKLAFAVCPTPLNTHCNPFIARDVNEFKDSCELAKIALAVWVAKPDVFSSFDRWMFSPEIGYRWQPRSIAAAIAKAVELVGQTKFDAARSDPWIDRHLQDSTAIFGDSLRLDPNSGAVPKLVSGPRWLNPQPRDVDDLMAILRESLAVPSPAP